MSDGNTPSDATVAPTRTTGAQVDRLPASTAVASGAEERASVSRSTASRDGARNGTRRIGDFLAKRGDPRVPRESEEPQARGLEDTVGCCVVERPEAFLVELAAVQRRDHDDTQ